MEYAVSRLTSEVSRTFKDTHIKTLISATYDNAVPMSELFRIISNRLRDERWIVVLKTLSLIHLLSREGNSERVLGFLCANNDILYQSFFRKHGPVSTRIIKGYSAYLEEKAGAFKILKYDWIRQQDEAVAKFRSIDDEAQLIRDSELLQKNMRAALGCAWEIDSSTDVVIQQAFRFILAEYFNLFLLTNESIVRVLGLYFQMEKKNALKTLELYKTFVMQTKRLQEIFQSAKQSMSMRVEIPNFNIPPVGLATKLEDYISDPDHEKKRLAPKSGSFSPSNTEPSFSLGQPSSSQSKKPPVMGANTSQVKDKPLIDFFDSVEDQHTINPQSNNTFSNGWDDQFSQQAAMQSTIQTQIQLTNQLLNSGAGAFPQNNFQQSNFIAPQSSPMFGAQNNAFYTFNSAGFSQPSNAVLPSTMNPFNQISNQNEADPFTSLASASSPTFSNPPVNIQAFNSGTASSGFRMNAFPSAAPASTTFSAAPNNSFISNTGVYNSYFGGVGAMPFASTMPPAASIFGQSSSFSPNMPSNVPTTSSGLFHQQQQNAIPFSNPNLIHNPAAFSVNDGGFGSHSMVASRNNMISQISHENGGNNFNPAQLMHTQMTGSSMNSNHNPFSNTGMNSTNQTPPFGGNRNNFRQIPSTFSNQQLPLQNQGTTLVSQFHATNDLTNNSVVGGTMYTTATVPRAVNSNQGFLQQQNSGEFQPNHMFGSVNGNQAQQLDQQGQRVQGTNNNHNPFF